MASFSDDRCLIYTSIFRPSEFEAGATSRDEYKQTETHHISPISQEPLEVVRTIKKTASYSEYKKNAFMHDKRHLNVHRLAGNYRVEEESAAQALSNISIWEIQ